MDSSWHGQPRLCVEHVEAKGGNGDDALAAVEVEVVCPGAYIPDPTVRVISRRCQRTILLGLLTLTYSRP